MTSSLTAADLRLPAGPVDLTAIDTDATPGFDGGKKAGQGRAGRARRRARPTSRSGSSPRATAGVGRAAVLLVLQGMDTSGKGGTLRHTVGLIDPQGVRITSFKAPTEEELAHDFLWRIGKALPEPGLHRRLRPLATTRTC